MIENRRSLPALWLVLLAAAGTFALTMGTRQTMGLFLSPINTSTGLGLGSISLAFAFGQLFWGLTQPFAGAVTSNVREELLAFVGEHWRQDDDVTLFILEHKSNNQPPAPLAAARSEVHTPFSADTEIDL